RRGPLRSSRGSIECRNGSRLSVSRGEGPLAPLGALSAHADSDEPPTRGRVGDGRRAVAERVEDLALAQQPVVDVLLDLRGGVLDDGPVRGIDALDAELL